MKKLKLASLILLAGASFNSAFAATKLDLNTPEGANMAMRKIQCSTIDDKPVFYWWKGKVFSRRQGEVDKHIFNVCLLYTSDAADE